jgi:uncharacterized protein (DUF4415 family)
MSPTFRREMPRISKTHGSIVRSKPDGSFVLIHPDGREEPCEVVATDLAKLDAMTDEDIARQIADDPDVAPEWTEEMFARAVLIEGDKVVPRRGPGRPKSEMPKKAVSLRLAPDVVEKFRAGGAGWQSRINATTLRAAITENSPARKDGGRAYAPRAAAKRAAAELRHPVPKVAAKKPGKRTAETSGRGGKTGKRGA